MIDLAKEQILSLDQAGKKVGVSFQTIWRWALKGLPGSNGQRVRVRAARLGGRWITSVEALQEFSRAMTPKIEELVPLYRSPGRRLRAAKRAGDELTRHGI